MALVSVMILPGCLSAPVAPEGDADSGIVVPSDGGGADADGSLATDAAVIDADLVCVETDTVPAVDGDREPIWLIASEHTMTIAEAAYTQDESGGGYQNDAVVNFRCLHDADDIFFLFEVGDGAQQAELVADGPSAREDDAIVLFLDTAGDRSGPYGPDDHAFILGAANATVEDASPAPYTPTIAGVAKGPDYTLELKLDKATLSTNPIMGVNVALIDDDSYGGDSLADMFALWRLPLPEEPPPCNDEAPFVWCNTTAFTTMYLDPS